MQPRFRIRDLLIGVFVVALALLFARYSMRHYDMEMSGAPEFWKTWFTVSIYITSFFAAAGICIGALVGLEAVSRDRDKSYPAWGPGRFTWSLTGITLLLVLIARLFTICLYLIQGTVRPISMDELAGELMRCMATVFAGQVLLSLLPALVVFRRTALPASATRDVYEWAGRIYLCLVVVWVLSSQAITLFCFTP
jgi:hypothetical protein